MNVPIHTDTFSGQNINSILDFLDDIAETQKLLCILLPSYHPDISSGNPSYHTNAVTQRLHQDTYYSHNVARSMIMYCPGDRYNLGTLIIPTTLKEELSPLLFEKHTPNDLLWISTLLSLYREHYKWIMDNGGQHIYTPKGSSLYINNSKSYHARVPINIQNNGIDLIIENLAPIYKYGRPDPSAGT